MPRPPRLQIANGIYHITGHAVQSESLFPTALERDLFEDILMIAIARAGWGCHWYCVMGTHYHLVVRTPEPNLAVGMKRLNWLYAWRYNKRFGSRGHVFESRYGSKLIESEDHAKSTVRYVALNPVEAGLSAAPAAWPWSSYRIALGHAPCPEFLSIDWALGLFDDRRVVARRALREFVEQPEISRAA